MMAELRTMPVTVGMGRRVEIELDTGSKDTVLHVDVQIGFRNMQGGVASREDLREDEVQVEGGYLRARS
jgi:hypothetical protein